MAKRVAKKANKTQAIRDYLKEHPKAMPKEAVPALKEKGVDVSATYFSMIKGKTKRRGRKRRRLASMAQGNAARGGGRRNGSGVTIEQLIAAKKLAERMGGVEAAKAALDVLARLG